MLCAARVALLASIVCMCGGVVVHAQECPEEDPNGPSQESVSRRLTGKIVYHDEIRQWFELVLDSPTCGQKAVQVLQGGGAFEVDEGNAHNIEVFRGCHVTVYGSLGIPGTGYYSADLYQNVDKIEPDEDCLKQPLFPDYSKSRPDRSVRNYRVRMKLDYSARGGKIAIAVSSDGRLLTPWQAYASYWLTGDYAFYGLCSEGFDLKRLRGTPEAKPWVIDNYAAMDPESAAEKQIRWVTMEFTCRKQPPRVRPPSDQ